MEISDWINLAGVIVSLSSVCVTIWIASIVQSALASERAIKDLFIKQIEGIGSKYISFYNKLLDGRVSPKEVAPWFKSINVEVDALCKKLSELYGYKTDMLLPFRHNLREMLTNDESFINSYKDPIFTISDSLKDNLNIFHQNNYHLFIDFICDVNSAKRRR